MRWLNVLAATALGLILAGPVAANCDFPTGRYIEQLSDIGSVRKIDVVVNKYRKWVRNGLTIITSNGEQILSAQKKNFGARVTVHYDFGTCTYNAKVRQNGDFKDHITFKSGRLYQSLSVKLEEGNIATAVRFKLFLPDTRNADSEILATLLLSRLGFLAPRTRRVHVTQNETMGEMLWQEVPSKEFLELNARREGPLFEGDETVLDHWTAEDGYIMEDLGLARLVNDKWVARGDASLAMAADAFDRLQRAYATYGNNHAADPSKALTGLAMPTTDNAKADQGWWDYAAVTFALRGEHALRPHNRKFYWNAFFQAFEPIYYDGEVDISQKQIWDMRDRDRDLYFNHFTRAGLERLKTLVESLDRDDFARRYVELCQSKCSPEDALEFLDKTAANLIQLADELELRPASEDTDPMPELADRFLEKFPNTDLLEITDYDAAADTATARICNAEDCRTETRTVTQLIDGMGGMTAGEDGGEVTLFVTPNGLSDYATTDVAEVGATVRHSRGAQVRFDAQRDRLHLVQQTPQDWFLISDADLGATEIVFEGRPGSAEVDSGQRFNAFGLTGCLTFFSTAFNGTAVTAGGGGCEDSVNIVESRGTLSMISISDAKADALDVDFSQITLENVRITNAGNDCLDFSGGRYEVIDALMKGCQDKAVSIGETSEARIHSVHAEDVAVGVSSKDGSKVWVGEMSAANSGNCYEVFQKKQEFFGARLTIDTMTCANPAAVIDENSIFESGKSTN